MFCFFINSIFSGRCVLLLHSIYLPIRLSIYQYLTIYLTIHLRMYRSTYLSRSITIIYQELSIYPPTYQYLSLIYLSIHLPINICLSSVSICLPSVNVCPPIYLSFIYHLCLLIYYLSSLNIYPSLYACVYVSIYTTLYVCMYHICHFLHLQL